MPRAARFICRPHDTAIRTWNKQGYYFYRHTTVWEVSYRLKKVVVAESEDRRTAEYIAAAFNVMPAKQADAAIKAIGGVAVRNHLKQHRL